MIVSNCLINNVPDEHKLFIVIANIFDDEYEEILSQNYDKFSILLPDVHPAVEAPVILTKTAG